MICSTEQLESVSKACHALCDPPARPETSNWNAETLSDDSLMALFAWNLWIMYGVDSSGMISLSS